MKFPKLALLCFSVLFSVVVTAQLRLPVNNALRSDLQKVVAEFTHNFESIRGEVINQNPQTTEYLSQVKIADAKECIITRYSSSLKPVYTWQALMFVSEDFEAAAKKYKWLFSQLKGMNVYHVSDQYSLQGKFEAAEEGSKNNSSVLTVFDPPAALKKLKLEVSLQFDFPEWKLNLLVYEKEKDDADNGEVMEQ